MKKVILSFAVIVTAMMLTGCGVNGGTPTGIVKNLYSALQKSDYTKAAKIELENTLEYAELSKEMREAFVPLVAEEMQKYAEVYYEGGVKSFEITEAGEEDDEGGVGIKVTDKSGDEHMVGYILFKKRDGKWWLNEKLNISWR